MQKAEEARGMGMSCRIKDKRNIDKNYEMKKALNNEGNLRGMKFAEFSLEEVFIFLARSFLISSGESFMPRIPSCLKLNYR